jgi:hypothetical protein
MRARATTTLKDRSDAANECQRLKGRGDPSDLGETARSAAAAENI